MDQLLNYILPPPVSFFGFPSVFFLYFFLHSIQDLTRSTPSVYHLLLISLMPSSYMLRHFLPISFLDVPYLYSSLHLSDLSTLIPDILTPPSRFPLSFITSTSPIPLLCSLLYLLLARQVEIQAERRACPLI